jgi:c-di-GMP-binding flagellar brake protein YcgR
MLGRTVSLWRRLVGGQMPAGLEGGDQAVADDRRVWVRHAADLETMVQTDSGTDGEQLSARVRNISLGGISLLVDRPFETGELLTIELPGVEENHSHTVLACVVHAMSHSDQEWALGCTFARELSDDDLQAYGARRVKHAGPDQRVWKRFSTAIKASFQVISAAEATKHPAQVLNISASGVGLAVTELVKVGALLSVELHGAHGSAERTLLACVVHANDRDDGEWALGCNFIRSLSEADLNALL